MSDLAAYEWRVGVGRPTLIYAMVGYDRIRDDYIGSMATDELAAAVVEEHNAAIRQAAATDCQPLAVAEDVEPTLARPSIAGEEPRQ